MNPRSAIPPRHSRLTLLFFSFLPSLRTSAHAAAQPHESNASILDTTLFDYFGVGIIFIGLCLLVVSQIIRNREKPKEPDYRSVSTKSSAHPQK